MDERQRLQMRIKRARHKLDELRDQLRKIDEIWVSQAIDQLRKIPNGQADNLIKFLKESDPSYAREVLTKSK